MIYRFVSKDSNVDCIGAIDAAELETKLQTYLDNGFALSDVEAFSRQLIKGATAGMIPDPSLPTSSAPAAT